MRAEQQGLGMEVATDSAGAGCLVGRDMAGQVAPLPTCFLANSKPLASLDALDAATGTWPWC